MQAFDNQRFYRPTIAATEALDFPFAALGVWFDFADPQFCAADLAGVVFFGGFRIVMKMHRTLPLQCS